MRLRKILKLLSTVSISDSAVTFTNSQQGLLCSNLNRFKQFIEILSSVPSMAHWIDFFRQSPFYSTNQDAVIVPLGTAATVTLQQAETRFIAQSQGMKELLHQMLKDESEFSIAVRLPDPTDFRDLLAAMDKLYSALSQSIVNPTIDGEVTILRWESGSYWLDLYVKRATAVALVAGLAWSAAVVYKKIAEGRIINEQVRSLEIKNESLEDIRLAQQAALDNFVAQQAQFLYDKHFNTSEEDPEQIGRLKYSIRTLAELIDKGAEINPALDAPESVANLFPRFFQGIDPTIPDQGDRRCRKNPSSRPHSPSCRALTPSNKSARRRAFIKSRLGGNACSRACLAAELRLASRHGWTDQSNALASQFGLPRSSDRPRRII